MKSFRDIADTEDKWTKEDLITLIQEEDLSDLDIEEITEMILDIIEYSDFSDMEDKDIEKFDFSNYTTFEDDNIDEKMSNKAKKDAAKKRRKPAFKRAMKLKKKCISKHASIIKKTKGTGTPKVCGTDGKLKKGMGRAERRKLAKTRKRNKGKIIN